MNRWRGWTSPPHVWHSVTSMALKSATTPVLALPAEHCIRQLGVGLARVRSALATPRFARTALARSLAAEREQFTEAYGHGLLVQLPSSMWS